MYRLILASLVLAMTFATTACGQKGALLKPAPGTPSIVDVLNPSRSDSPEKP